MAVLTLEDFRAAVGTECHVSSGGQSCTMVMIAADPIPSSVRPGGGYRLEFMGPPEPLLAQSIMRVAGDFGDHDIFMVPILQNEKGITYEAIFN
jgi:hypothetical protein